MNPQTASDAEVDAWLAEHCPEAYEALYKKEGVINGEWHPTQDYDQLTLCEAKVKDRCYMHFQWSPILNQWCADTTLLPSQSEEEIKNNSELSARARLVVAILQFEQEAERG